MQLDWSTPVTRPFVGDAWVRQMVPHWAVVLKWIHGIAVDPILQQDFAAACAILDRNPQPSTPESANRRWREFVAALWKALDGWKARYAKRRKRR